MDMTLKFISKDQFVKILPQIDLRKCSGCNKCIVSCQQNVLELKNINADKKSHAFFKFKKLKANLINPEKCTGCKVCASVCKHRAIRFYY